VLSLVAMSLNHALKTVIRNPRPFQLEGTHLRNWAVSPGRAAELATEFSTPSGHAMSTGTFYAILFAATRNRWARAGFVVCALMVGISRPYLGVHYVEDVLLGWGLGLALAVVALHYEDTIAEIWGRLAPSHRALLLVGGSLALWLATRAVGGGVGAEPPAAFVSYAGLLTGILVAQPLEARLVDFDPRSGGLGRKLLRGALTVVLVLGTLAVLGRGFSVIAADYSALGHLLRYVRYVAAAVTGLFLAPLLLTRVGLATPMGERVAPAVVDGDLRMRTIGQG
jgi:hypothetical protein